MDMRHRRPLFGSVCSEMTGNGPTRATALSDIGILLNRIMMDTVYCTSPMETPCGTEVVGFQMPSSATMVRSRDEIILTVVTLFLSVEK